MTTNILNLEEKLLRYNYIISKEVLNIISSQQSKKKKKARGFYSFDWTDNDVLQGPLGS